MKKLLAAVTSFVMSASFATSAFTSSFTVSAAGGVSAAQPNVSMGEVTDASANKNAQADFIVSAPDITVDAGTSVEVEFKVNSGNHKGILLNTKIGNMPAGITYSLEDATLYCIQKNPNPTYYQVGDEYHAEILDDKGDASSFNDNEPIMVLKLNIPNNATPGRYEYGLDFLHVVEVSGAGDPPVAPVEFDATIKKGTITINDPNGNNNGNDPGNDPGNNPGNDPGNNPGNDPGNNPGNNPGNDPGNNPGSRPETGNYNDFQIIGKDTTVMPGDSVEVEFFAKANGHKVVLAQCEPDFPNGLTCVIDDDTSYAFNHMPTYKPLDTERTKWSLEAMDPDSADASPVNENEPIAIFKVTAPSNAQIGDVYYCGFKVYHVVEVSGAGVPPVPAVEFDAKVVYAAVTIGDGKVTSSTNPTNTTSKTTSKTTTSTASTTKGGQEGSTNPPTPPVTSDRPSTGDYDDFQIIGKDIELEAGQTGEMEFFAVANGHKVILAQCEPDFGQVSALIDDDTSYAFDHMPTYKPLDSARTKWSLEAMDPDTSEASPVNENEPIAIFKVTAPSNAQVGDVFYCGFKTYHVVEVSGAGIPPVPAVEFEAKVVYGAIKIVDGTTTKPGTTSTKPGTTSTKPSTSSTNPSTSSKNSTSSKATTSSVKSTDPVVTTSSKKNEVASGKAEWVIDTVKIDSVTKDTEVEVKVYVNGDSDLAVAGASFDINYAEKSWFKSVSEKSEAYGAIILNNAEISSFAFSDEYGAGSTATDGKAVMTLKFVVPANTADGTYDLKWAKAFITDTNGNDITSSVKLTNGSIIIGKDNGNGDTPDPGQNDGKVSWIIPEVHAKAGEKVDLDIKVKAGDNNIGVAGGQFDLIHKLSSVELVSVSKTDAYYGFIYNKVTNEFAFAGITNVKAENGSTIIRLTYSVPENAEPGRYDVNWSEVFVCDENGEDITSSIECVSGAIIIDEPDNGDISWIIPEEKAVPGGKAEMDVKVKVGKNNLAVAGAKFNIAVDSEYIELESVSGSDAYKSIVLNNKKTNEFAFAEAIGDGIKAEDGTVVLHLTYKVSDNAPAGKYDVKWSGAFISDTNGKEITSSVELVDGAIIIDTPTTTSETTPITSTTPISSETTTVSTSGTTSTSSQINPPVSTEPIPEGGIAWDIEDKVPAKPGDVVAVKVIVNDPDDAKLAIGGAQYGIKAIGPEGELFALESCSDSSDAYGATILSNPNSFEFAFADANGEGKVAADGKTVMTLMFKVPDNCPDGEYPVTFDKNFSFISSAEGLDITKLVDLEPGSILVENNEPTTTEPPVTTSKKSESSTTVSSTKKTTSSVSTVSTEPAPTTSTKITVPVPYEIIWEVGSKVAHPGETVSLDIKVLDPDDAKLEVGGAQFRMDVENKNITLTGYEGYEAYGCPVLGDKNETNKFAFSRAIGDGVAAADNSTILTLEYTVPEGTLEGKYDVSMLDLEVKDENGNDITDKVYVMNGYIQVIIDPVTTSTTATTSKKPSSTTSKPSTTESTSSSKKTTSTVKTTVSSNLDEPVTTSVVSTDIDDTPVPDGSIKWDLDTASGKPGEIVELTMIVENPNGAKINVSGAQFVLLTDPKLISAAGTPYEGSLFYNPTSGEMAFVNPTGAQVASENGAIMLTVKYQIPEDATPGTVYEVNISNIVAMNSKGNDVSKNIVGGKGTIVVLPNEVTTSNNEDDVTTTSKNDDVVTTTETVTTVITSSVDQPGSEETSTVSTPVVTSSDIDEPTVTTSSDVEPSLTTSSNNDNTEPGVTSTTVTEPIVTTDNNPGVTTSDDTPAATTTDIIGSDPVDPSVTTTVSDGGEDPADTTSQKWTVAPDYDTNTTTTKRGSIISADAETMVETVDGFYFNHDGKPFKVDHVLLDKEDLVFTVVEEGTGQVIKEKPDPALFTFMDAAGHTTPGTVYNEEQTDFTYTIYVYYDGQRLEFQGKPITFTAYIGVKGDTNFDNIADASDASNILYYYARSQTGGAANTRLTPDDLQIVNDNLKLDEFAAFLADVDLDVYSVDNWKMPKEKRGIDSADASSVLAYYAQRQTDENIDANAAWNKVFEGVTPSRASQMEAYEKG